MFVAVRAMAPVAGIPPIMGEAILATPWAINSMLERWRLPVMPSATTAESNDSIPANTAIVNAGELIFVISSKLMLGKCGIGNVFGTPPKRLPIVSSGR
jgi:hypothetical protein